MINVSNKFRGILSIGPEWHVRIEYRLKNGDTGALTDMDLIVSTLQFIDSTSPSGSFEVGQAASQGMKVTLNNYQGKFTEAELEGAVFTPYIGLVTKMDWQGYQMEWCQRGIFTADDVKSVGLTIQIFAVDKMANFDKVYSESTLTYPATLGQILTDACSVCGVTQATDNFTNMAYSVAERPSDTSTTFRDIVSYVAALSGNFARINADGALELRWYDLSKFALPDDDPARPVDFVGITSSDIAKTDTTIAGVAITGNDEDKTVYKAGADGFVISIGNPLAQDGLQDLVNALGVKLIGFTFRPFSADANANPAIEAGDVCYIKDSSGNSYRSIVTNLTYTLSGSESFSADAETSAQNQSAYFSPAQKAQDAADKANHGVAKAEIRIGDLEIEIVGKVSFSDLSESGKTVINGDNIVTGKIQSENGRVYFDLNGNEASVSRLVSATDDATDVYADIGTVSWANGSTSKGMGLFSGDGMIAYLDQAEEDGSGSVGLEVASNGKMRLRSNAITSSQNNTIEMQTNSSRQGDIGIWRADGSTQEEVFHAYNGTTVLFGEDSADIETESGNMRIHVDSSGIYFYAGGNTLMGKMDVSGGWNGRLYGAKGITRSVNLEDGVTVDGTTLHFSNGLLTSVDIG